MPQLMSMRSIRPQITIISEAPTSRPSNIISSSLFTGFHIPGTRKYFPVQLVHHSTIHSARTHRTSTAQGFHIQITGHSCHHDSCHLLQRQHCPKRTKNLSAALLSIPTGISAGIVSSHCISCVCTMAAGHPLREL
jgi:hypothetical protein